MAPVLSSVLLCASLVGGARVSHTGRTPSGSLGEVDALYTTGAPAVAVGPLRNAKSADGCFAGMRYFTRDKSLLGEVVDLVPMVAYVGGFVHPMYRATRLDLKGSEPIEYPCSTSTQKVPDGIVGKIMLHGSPMYIEGGSLVNEDLESLMTRVAQQSENQDFDSMKKTIEGLGWRVAAESFDEGKLVGGPQVSYLWQHPESLECMVTFQGSASVQDWLVNLNMDKVDFCGLSEQVHEGFHTHLLMMVGNEGWQSRVRPLLGKCAKVFSVGQSLGAAKASLFAACVNNAPESGPGVEHFQQMFWKKEAPARLPYL
jgi:hypothetical protein